MNNLSVVLCTFNEELYIKKTLNILIKEKIINEIIIIDDNSEDKTVHIIKKIKNKKIKLFERKNIRDFASALRLGIRKTKNKFVLRFDVDMYSNIYNFIEAFNKHSKKDCIIFSRYVHKGKDLRGNFRKFSSIFLNMMCRTLLSNKIKDYTSCIMIFNKKILKDIVIDNTSYANFIIKFCYFLIKKKKKFIEIPFTQKKITENKSKSAPNVKIFIKHGLMYFLTILECFFIKKN